MKHPKRFESISQPGLFYWAEPNGGGAGAIESYCVVAQAKGGPASEAHDDWFCHLADAERVAEQMANGTLPA